MNIHDTSSSSRPAPRARPGGLLDTRELAELLGCSISTVKRQVAAGVIPVIKIGRLVRFRRSDVAAMIDALAATPGESTRRDEATAS